MMSAVEDLQRTSARRFKLVKVNAADNRSICREAKVLSLPTFILFRDSEEFGG
jgi:thioredoxin-like negative regulator of GroEL